MRQMSVCAVTTVLIGSLCSPALPAIYSANDPAITPYTPTFGEYSERMHFTTGSGNVTVDTATGLAWLDVTLTRGFSHDDILPLLLPGEHFDGYRVASADEVAVFWQQAGIIYPNLYEYEDDAAARRLQKMWGITNQRYDHFPPTLAITSTPSPAGVGNGGYNLAVLKPEEPAPGSVAYIYPGYTVGSHPEDFAPALVREWDTIIPEPASVAVWSLLALAGIGFGWWRRRR